MKFSFAIVALSAVAFGNGHEVHERFDSYEEPRYESSMEEGRYDSSMEARYESMMAEGRIESSWEEPRYDSYEEPRYDSSMEEGRYDSMMEEGRSYDSYKEPRYDSYEERGYDSYEEPRENSYEEARYDEVIEEMDGRGSVRGAAPKSSHSGTHKHARAHSGTHKHARAHVAHHATVREESPGEVLGSEQCTEVMSPVMEQFNELLKLGDDAVIDFFCNPLERKELLEDAHEAEKEAAEESNPCVKALDDEIVQDLPLLDEKLASSESCAEELAKELAEYRKILEEDEERRRLIKDLIKDGLEQVTVPTYNNVTYCKDKNGNGINDVTDCTMKDVKVFAVKVVIPFVLKKVKRWFRGWSDERLKENVKLVGTSPSGIPIYTFNYKEGMKLADGETLDTKSTFSGVMAQDVLKLKPKAVMKSPVDGYYRVDYSEIDVDFRKVL